ncbi:T9SS type A sorting domain-containing protein [Flavicella marina]|uniref:T9SS type A sorting domain-containing protein n=1 Tax=Flavicella marina TaxID=1475951 RepID=UPI001263FB29|nr:T9SS type A sorting domain-containing protein [Flavicella marina]
MKSFYQYIFICFISFGFSWIHAQETNVFIDPNCQKFLNGISEIDRAKFFSVHDTGMDNDQSKFRADYNVSGGRGFWGAFSYANSKTGEVGVYPDPKPNNGSIKSVLKNYVATEHPRSVYKFDIDVVAAGDWAAEYYNNFANDSGRQEYFEVMNEPFVHADDFYEGWDPEKNQIIKVQMAELYNEVGKRIHNKPELVNMKVIGYSSAWPSLELWDFGHWNDSMKMFMDTAGDNMYGFSTHLYDGINVTGQDSKRSGSNSEAILDMIENYSMIKWNKVKPHAITEYGAIEKGYGDDYSDLASVQTVASINHILFNLLDREDRICVSIPFITGKATWHITPENNYQPYGAVLWKPTNIGVPVDQIEGWEYTPRIFFYELWKNVKGKRVFIKSDNPDIQTHAFIDGSKMYVALSNLDDNEQTVNLKMLSNLAGLESIQTKNLKIFPQKYPLFDINTSTTAPEQIHLIKDEFVMLEYNFSDDIIFDNSINMKNYYATNYLEPISTNNTINYTFSNVAQGNGYATLRMSIGRKHDVTKQPTVLVNGVQVPVPTNYKGYDQANRDDFFGMIEIPVPSQLINENTTVSVTFPDNGGHISSMILVTEFFEKPINVLDIKTVSNPCPDSSEGQIVFYPIVEDNYTATITQDNFNQTFEFNSKLTVENLHSGAYNIVLTAQHNTALINLYTVVINDPTTLDVKTQINKISKKLLLTLKGSNAYNISINEKLFRTNKNIIELPLSNGENILEVTTDKECVGSFEEKIVIGGEIIGYPNPFQDEYIIDFGTDNSNTCSVQIFNSLGQKVISQKLEIKNRKIELKTVSLKKGLYILKTETPLSNNTLTITKN